MGWRTTPSGLAVRLFAILAGVTFIATSRYSHTVFVTSIVVVAIVGLSFAIGLIKIRRHFERYPMYPKPKESADDERSNPQ